MMIHDFKKDRNLLKQSIHVPLEVAWIEICVWILHIMTLDKLKRFLYPCTLNSQISSQYNFANETYSWTYLTSIFTPYQTDPKNEGKATKFLWKTTKSVPLKSQQTKPELDERNKTHDKKFIKSNYINIFNLNHILIQWV